MDRAFSTDLKRRANNANVAGGLYFDIGHRLIFSHKCLHSLSFAHSCIGRDPDSYPLRPVAYLENRIGGRTTLRARTLSPKGRAVEKAPPVPREIFDFFGTTVDEIFLTFFVLCVLFFLVGAVAGN